ncbi:MAG: EI24 domain-containing protein [Janthinobacterium lividum]
MRALLRALRQLEDPVFAGVLLRSVLWSAAGFGLLCWGGAWGAHHWLAVHGGAWHGAWSWLGGAAATVLAGAAALFLFQPVAVVIATFYLERVAGAVDRAWYPALPEPKGASLAVQAWDGLAIGGAVLALNVVALVLALLLPGVGLLLGWAVAAWAIGRGLFVAVAMRRMGREAALQAYARQRGAVLLQGAVLAAASVVPGLNLLVPVIGVAAMVHVLHGGRA